MSTDGMMSKSEIIAYLEDYAVNEGMGARLFHAWASTSSTPSLRGALRMMELREQAHADLLAQRAKELGGSGTAAPDQTMIGDFLAFLGAPDRSDADKLREFMRLAPPDQVVDRLNKDVARLGSDPESQALLRAIVDDERSTLWALREAASAIPAAA